MATTAAAVGASGHSSGHHHSHNDDHFSISSGGDGPRGRPSRSYTVQSDDFNSRPARSPAMTHSPSPRSKDLDNEYDSFDLRDDEFDDSGYAAGPVGGGSNGRTSTFGGGGKGNTIGSKLQKGPSGGLGKSLSSYGSGSRGFGGGQANENFAKPLGGVSPNGANMFSGQLDALNSPNAGGMDGMKMISGSSPSGRENFRSVRQILRFCGREQSKTSSSMNLDFPSSPRKKSCLFSCTKAKVIEFVTGRIGGELEPRTIDLKGIAQKHGKENWMDIPSQQQALLIHQALSENLAFLIDPTAGYMKIWDIVIMCALLFTCFVTPFEVGFILPLAGSRCEFTVLNFCNRLIDVIFLKDMIMQFFLKVEQKSRRGTVLLRDQRQIVRKYLSGWFLIDFMSIIPYDLITCWSGKSLGTFRIFRLLRLMKLARIFRASRLFKRWQDHISLSFATIALAKFGLGILLLSHWMACLWGLTGLEFTGKPTNCYLQSDPSARTPNCPWPRQTPDSAAGAALASSTSSQQFAAGLGSSPVCRDLFHDWSDESWVKATFRPGSNPDDPRSYHQDDPCNEFSVYLISLHWSVMTITSIGYGDITPTQWNEYLVCVIVMFIASFSWAYVMGNACSVIMNMDPVRVEFEQSMDQLNSMMKEQLVPPALQRKLRENMREAQNLHRLLRSRELSKDMAPSIKCELVMHTSSQWIKDVTFLRGCSPSFILDLVDGFDVLMFSRKEKINMPYVRLCVVERGAVGRAGKVLVPGSVWGEDVILADRRLQHVAHTTALTFVQLLSLGKEQLDHILRGYPKERRHIRKIACKLALRRAASIVANFSKKKTLGDIATFQGPKLLRIFDSGSAGPDKNNPGMNNPKVATFGDLLHLFSKQELDAANSRGSHRFSRHHQRDMEYRIRDDIAVLKAEIREIASKLPSKETACEEDCISVFSKDPSKASQLQNPPLSSACSDGGASDKGVDPDGVQLLSQPSSGNLQRGRSGWGLHTLMSGGVGRTGSSARGRSGSRSKSGVGAGPKYGDGGEGFGEAD